MKLTKTKLKQIIKEEIESTLAEARRSYVSQQAIDDYATELHLRSVSDNPEHAHAKGYTDQDWNKKIKKIIRWVEKNSSNLESTERAIEIADEKLKSGKF